MAMDRTKRVIYEKNPLMEVILQVKYPKILSINAREPADFQDAIRQVYPIYQNELENEHELALPAKGNILFPPIIQQQQHRNHNFISKDGQYKINLTDSFLALSTLSYTCWEDMLDHLANPLRRLIEIYRPAFFERVGLRYVDVFLRTKLGLQDRSWRELIEPAWLGAMSSLDESQVVASGLDVAYLLDDGISQAKIHTGLGNVNDDPESAFIIDSDFIHINNIEPSQFKEIAEYLHTAAGMFIRSAIKELLHEAMIPGDLS